MIALSPPLLLATANAFVDMEDDRPVATGGARGTLAARFLREVGVSPGAGEIFPFAPEGEAPAEPEAPAAPTEAQTPSAPARVFWDAAFVHHIGFWSHYDPREERSWWPLPITTDLRVLASFAIERCILRHAPVTGDVFLLASPSTDEFHRVGIIERVEHRLEMEDGTDAFEAFTIEGDTSPDLQLGGGRILRHWRRLSAVRGDRFLRWTRLDQRVERTDHVERAVEAHAARCA